MKTVENLVEKRIGTLTTTLMYLKSSDMIIKRGAILELLVDHNDEINSFQKQAKREFEAFQKYGSDFFDRYNNTMKKVSELQIEYMELVNKLKSS